MFTYSLCMIVRDEEAVLKRCLESYHSLFDEIIIVDTGSKDATKKIAAEYTDKIYDFEWEDDFSAARNFAFSKCSCDYIFSADADEYIDEENVIELSVLMRAMDSEIDIVQMKYVEENSAVLSVKKEYRPKLFKRVRTFVWEDPIHETVRLTPIVFDSNIEILHKPHSDGHEDRDFRIFKKAFASGERQSANMYRMYAKELYRLGKEKEFAEAIDAYESRINMKDIDPDAYCTAACVLARAYRLGGDIAKFFGYGMKAYTSRDPVSEICYEYGLHYHGVGDYDEAMLWYALACNTQPLIDAHYGGDLPLYRLAECAKEMGEFDEMERYVALAEKWELPEGD